MKRNHNTEHIDSWRSLCVKLNVRDKQINDTNLHNIHVSDNYVGGTNEHNRQKTRTFCLLCLSLRWSLTHRTTTETINGKKLS